MIEITVEGSKRKIISHQDLNFIDAGGQGVIYRYRDLVLKFHEDKTIVQKSRMIKMLALKYIKKRSDVSMPESLEERSFIIGSGTAKGSDIERTEDSILHISIFRWLEGTPLDYRDRSLNFTQRKNIVYHILKGLLFFESIGIVHSDLFPKNFLLKNDLPHFIDIEGAGILNRTRTEWDFAPSVLGTPTPGFGTPPEIENDTTNQYTDRWYGLNLIFMILLGFSPFFFLSRCDPESTEKIYLIGQKNMKESKNRGTPLVWPPIGIENHPYIIKDCINNLDKSRTYLFDNHINKTLVRLCYKTFISGFKEQTSRESFNRMFRLLGL